MKTVRAGIDPANVVSLPEGWVDKRFFDETEMVVCPRGQGRRRILVGLTWFRTWSTIEP